LPGAPAQGLIALVLAALVAVAPAAAAPRAGEDPRVHAQRLEALRRTIEEVRQELARTRGEATAEERRLRQAELAIGRLDRDLRSLRRRVGEEQARLDRLGRDIAALRGRLEQHRELLARQLRASYAMGRQEQLKLLLSQEDPGRVQRALVYYGYLNRARQARIEAVRAELAELARLQAEAAASRQALQAALEQQEARRRELAARREERARILAGLKGQLRAENRRLEALRRDEAELERVVQALTRVESGAGAREEPFRRLKGHLPWPAAGPLAVSFGARRGQGGLRWKGVLIRAPAGREVRAVARGRVAFADWLRGYGLLLIIDHGDGYMSLYGHNQSLYKDVGEWVEGGEVIASVGDSGGQAGTALYFELRSQGRPVDPVAWCVGRRRRG